MDAAEFDEVLLDLRDAQRSALVRQGTDRPVPTLCRGCGLELKQTFIDLGHSPLANSYLSGLQLFKNETLYPLHVFVCEGCLLVQLREVTSPESIFLDYPYLSSISTSWVEHARRYCEMMVERFGFGPGHRVVEIASNDGYLLQWFKAKGIPVLGVEPAASIAKLALELRGIPSIPEFFGVRTANEMVAAGQSADLLLGNNVLAHVPDVHDFVAGMKVLLHPQGIVTMEFPHVLDLILGNQFDTIYHEHFSYFSFHSVNKIFAAHDLELFDVEELSTHGGSLRIFAQHAGAAGNPVSQRVRAVLAKEEQAKLNQLAAYESFWARVKTTKLKLLRFLVDAKEQGKSIAGYGAPAKGNTLLNYCGIGRDFIDYTVDRNPYKQGMFLPGSHIPIHAPERLRETRPDFVLILPWNLQDEIMEQTAFIREWGGRWVVPIPEVRIIV